MDTIKIENIICYLRFKLNLQPQTIIKIDIEDLHPQFIGGCICHNNYNFTLLLNPKNSPREMVDTIIHEMRHVYQHQSGIFKRINDTYSWKGINYKHSDYPTCKHPHEVDANKYMKEMRNEIYEVFLS